MERTISYITISKQLISVFFGFNYSTVLEFVFALFAFYLSIVIGETFAYGCISTQIMLLFAIILFYTNLYSGAYFGRRRLYSPLFFPQFKGTLR
jgi:hypothetical protein